MLKLGRGMGDVVPNLVLDVHLLPNLDQRWVVLRHHLCNHVSDVQSLECGRLWVAVVREVRARKSRKRGESGRGGESVVEEGG